jgi:hypothetical protein
MAQFCFNVGKTLIVQGKANAGVTTLKAALVYGTKTGINEDLTTMQAVEDVTSVTLNGVGNRPTLTSVTVTTDQTDNRAEIDCAAFSFAADAGQSALALILYDATTDTNETTRIPIAFFDTNFGAGIAMDGGLNVSIPTELLYVA